MRTLRVPAPLSPEAALLVACTRLKMRDEHRADAESAIARHPDWELFLSAARLNGVIAFAHTHLSAGFGGRIPAAILHTLQQETLKQARRNLRVTANLLSLLRLFADHGIPVVSLKGPALAQSIYGSVALRKMRDLDFLVRPSDIPRVLDLLRLRDYNGTLLQSGLDELSHRYRHHLDPMVSKTSGQTIEIHYWLLSPIGRQRFGLDALIARTRTETFMDVPIATFSPEDLLVYLCEHGSSHVWNRLEWICVVAELLRSGQVQDWRRVTDFANQFDGLRRLTASLLIARELLDAPVPDEMVRPDRWTRKAARSVIDRLRAAPGRRPTPAESIYYDLATDRGFSSRLRRCWITFAAPQVSDVVALPLPRVFWPVYSLVRPLRLLIRRAKTTAK